MKTCQTALATSDISDCVNFGGAVLRYGADKNFMTDSLSSWIRGLREHMKLDQDGLAKKVGKGQGTISRWESGKSRPEADVRGILYDLATRSGYPVDALSLAIGRPTRATANKAPVVGYIGAGCMFYPIDDHALGGGMDEVDAPTWIEGDCVAAAIRGDSMHPLQDGWLVFWSREREGVPDGCINKLCICQIADDGPTLLKEVRRGSVPGRFHLVSWNAPIMEDQALEWASVVEDIRPT